MSWKFRNFVFKKRGEYVARFKINFKQQTKDKKMDSVSKKNIKRIIITMVIYVIAETILYLA